MGAFLFLIQAVVFTLTQIKENTGYKNAFAFLIAAVPGRNYRFLKKINVVRSVRDEKKNKKNKNRKPKASDPESEKLLLANLHHSWSRM